MDGVVEGRIRLWLEAIGETDQEAVETFVESCRGDEKAQVWVVQQLISRQIDKVLGPPKAGQ